MGDPFEAVVRADEEAVRAGHSEGVAQGRLEGLRQGDGGDAASGGAGERRGMARTLSLRQPQVERAPPAPTH